MFQQWQAFWRWSWVLVRAGTGWTGWRCGWVVLFMCLVEGGGDFVATFGKNNPFFVATFQVLPLTL
jgi:hypothetical protein